MRILFIVDDTLFFLPEWFEKTFLKLQRTENIVGITPLITRHHPTLYSYLIKNLTQLGFISIIKMTKVITILKLKELSFELKLSTKPITLKQVARKYNIKVVNSNNVNNTNYLKTIKKLKPDIIFSSCSQIFKEGLLSLPTISCINRHSALLPSYGGLFPIFQAMIKKEKRMGVTIHKMIKGIDQGNIIYQSQFKISSKDCLFELYKKAYQESVEASVRAIYVIKNNLPLIIVKTDKASYYSFPRPEDWKKFFKLNLKFI